MPFLLSTDPSGHFKESASFEETLSDLPTIPAHAPFQIVVCHLTVFIVVFLRDIVYYSCIQSD